MDRKAACLAEAAACRAKAEADAVNRDYGVDESIKWLERAVDTSARLAVTSKVDDGSPSSATNAKAEAHHIGAPDRRPLN
jgi:hypothetical protein